MNEAWQGKRFKTQAYRSYEKVMLEVLPERMSFQKGLFSKKDKLKLVMEIGFSNEASDLDNPLKPLLDVLQKKYKFNDKKIYEITLRKTIVTKGQEYVKFVLKVK